MIEKVILDYLSGALDVPVYMEMPEDTTVPAVLIEKTGGLSRNRVYESTVAIQTYGNTLYDAAELNERVKEAMDNLASQPEVSHVGLIGDYNFTNYNRSSSKLYRYQAVYQISHY